MAVGRLEETKGGTPRIEGYPSVTNAGDKCIQASMDTPKETKASTCFLALECGPEKGKYMCGGRGCFFENSNRSRKPCTGDSFA